MRIVVTGASGLLGRRLVDKLARGHDVLGTSFSGKDNRFAPLDVTDAQQTAAFFERSRPDVVVHAAAITDTDLCEVERAQAYKINVVGTVNVVDACRTLKSKLVHISSDFVFDGRNSPYDEKSGLSPINYYGETKAEAEGIVRGLKGSIILRPTVLWGKDDSGRRSFRSGVIDALSKGRSVAADDTIVKYPLLVDDVGAAARLLIEKDQTGVFHLCGPEGLTKYRWAQQIARSMHLPVDLINSNGSPGRAPRPRDVRLEDTRIKDLGFRYMQEKLEDSLRVVSNQEGCTFGMIYSARPDVLILGQSASDFRVRLGKRLAQEHPAEANIVVPIPESGNFGAMGFSEESGIPFYAGIIRDYIVPRTLEYVSTKARNVALERKLIAVPDMVRDRDLVLIDEAIVTGTTMGVTIKKLRDAGARKIHVRIFSPPMTDNCYNGVLASDTLLAVPSGTYRPGDTERDLARSYNADSLAFISYDGFVGALARPGTACTECFGGKKRV